MNFERPIQISAQSDDDPHCLTSSSDRTRDMVVSPSSFSPAVVMMVNMDFTRTLIMLAVYDGAE